MKNYLLTAGILLFLGAWNFQSLNWSAGTRVVLSDGGVCVDICSDGGNIFVDGGCPDGGPGSCTNLDGGFAAGPSTAITSDLVFANSAAALTCYAYTPADSYVNLSLQLVGSNDSYRGLVHGFADGGTLQNCNIADGGYCTVSWSAGVQTVEGMPPWLGVQEVTNHSDGGILCCPVALQ